MRLPVMPPVAPMLAKSVPEIPSGALSFEPKWDGFRSIIFRDGDEVEIGSRNGKPMTRYFPEVVDAVLACTGPVTQILDHMARAPEPPAPGQAAVLLRGVLCDALGPLGTAAPRDELRVAARLLDAAAGLIVDEIVLVPHAPRRIPAGRGRRGCPGA